MPRQKFVFGGKEVLPTDDIKAVGYYPSFSPMPGKVRSAQVFIQFASRDPLYQRHDTDQKALLALRALTDLLLGI